MRGLVQESIPFPSKLFGSGGKYSTSPPACTSLTRHSTLFSGLGANNPGTTMTFRRSPRLVSRKRLEVLSPSLVLEAQTTKAPTSDSPQFKRTSINTNLTDIASRSGHVNWAYDSDDIAADGRSSHAIFPRKCNWNKFEASLFPQDIIQDIYNIHWNIIPKST